MNFTGKEIIGMIHLAGPSAIEKALEEIKIYEEEGLYGIIVENYHGSVNDVIYTLKEINKIDTKLKIGINILPNELELAYSIADEYNVDFIQFDYVSGVYNRGKTKIDTDLFIELREKYPNIYILGGVWPKYYKPVHTSVLKYDILMGTPFCDSFVVTGKGTGMETDLDKIKYFKEEVNKFNYKQKLIIGAGLNPLNVEEQLLYADGAIVGSAFKPLGNTRKKVDRELVKEFMSKIN